jgi:hypothetical protein
MFKQLYDRLAYALIGFMFGALIAMVRWYLYDAGFSRRYNAPEIHASLSSWIKYVGGFFATIGFLFRDGVGTAIGRTSSEVYEYEANRNSNPEVSRWLVVVALVAVVVGPWYYLRVS